MTDQPPVSRKDTTMADAIYSSSTLIAATRDPDLVSRITALGAARGLSQSEVESKLVPIAAAAVDPEGNTIASGYEFAVANYEPTPAPGADPSKVRDDQIKTALAAVFPDAA